MAAPFRKRRLAWVVLAVSLPVGLMSVNPVAAAPIATVTTLTSCSQASLAQAIARGGLINYGTNCVVSLLGSNAGSAITVAKGITAKVDGNGHRVVLRDTSGVGGRDFRAFMVSGWLTLDKVAVSGGVFRGASGRGGASATAGGTVQGAGFYVEGGGRLDLIDSQIDGFQSIGGPGGSSMKVHASVAGNGGAGGGADGGAIYNAGYTNMVQCWFTHDESLGGVGGNSVGSPGRKGSRVRVAGKVGLRGKHGGRGGAAADGGPGGQGLGGVVYNTGSVTIFSSIFVNDRATGAAGGASIGGVGGSGANGTRGRSGGAGGPGGASRHGGMGGDAGGAAVFSSGSARLFATIIVGSAVAGGNGGASTGGRAGDGGVGGRALTGGRGGDGGFGGRAHHGGTGGSAYGGAVDATGVLSLAGDSIEENSLAGGNGGRSIGGEGGDGGQGGSTTAPAGAVVGLGGAGGDGGRGASAGLAGRGGSARGGQVFSSGSLSWADSGIGGGNIAAGKGGAPGLAGRGGRGAKGGRGSGNGRHGLRGAGGHDGEGNPAGLPGSKQSLPVVSTKGLSYPTITATPSKPAAFNHHSEIRVSSAYSKDYAEPPLASEQNKLQLPVMGGHRARRALRAARRNTISLPTFTRSFRAVGNSWRYTMVGSAPSAGSKTTKVQVVVVPVNVDFGGQRVLDSAAAVKQIEMSPIFQPAQFTSGTTQYVDAMQRAEFWTVLQHKAQNYHLLLDLPITTQPWTFHVPASLGLIEMSAGSPAGLAEIGSWDAALRELVSTELDVHPNTLVITVSATNELFQNGCCIGGYHTAYPTPSGVDTAIWADVPAPGQILGITSPNNDVAISHEVEEWANDPYGDNQVPVAIQPGTNQCGLQLLEVGDAVEALPHPEFGVPLNGQVYQVQDVAGVSWFADQKPSMEQNGLYSYDGKLTGPAKYCVGG